MLSITKSTPLVYNKFLNNRKLSPNYNIKIIKKNNNVMTLFKYSNLLFSVFLNDSFLSFKTKYVFPSMILNGLHNYVFSSNTDEYSLDIHGENIDNEIAFDINESLPYEVMIICKLALKYNFINFEYNNVEDIILTSKSFEQKYNEDEIDRILRNFKKYNRNIYGNLTILNKEWMNMDSNCYGGKNNSPYTNSVLDEINNKISSVIENDNLPQIRSAAVMQGGLYTEVLDELFNYKNDTKILRCCGDDNELYRKYTICQVPILSVLLFNDLLISSGVDTDLIFNFDNTEYKTNSKTKKYFFGFDVTYICDILKM